MEERVTELEVKISFLENTIEDLNEALISRGKDIEKIERELAKIRGHLEQKDNEPPIIELPPE